MTAFGLCQHEEMARLPTSFVCSFPLLTFPLCQCSCLGDRLAENERLTCWEGTEPGWGLLPVAPAPAHGVRSVYWPTASCSFCGHLLLWRAAFGDRLWASAATTFLCDSVFLGVGNTDEAPFYCASASRELCDVLHDIIPTKVRACLQGCHWAHILR